MIAAASSPARSYAAQTPRLGLDYRKAFTYLESRRRCGMSLTVGSGPLARNPAGRFNFEIDRSRALVLWDPVPQRVRAMVEGETVVDSRRAVLLHETGHLPVYYFPEEDLRSDLVEPSTHVTHCPHKGEASYLSVRVGERHLPNAIWAYRDPLESASFLAGHVALVWSSFDEWFVEDEQAFGHPRDPYSRIDVSRTTRQVRIMRDGELLADSRRAKVLFETALPPRYYLPADDVRTELLVPSSKRTRCAYKGSAVHWHVRVGDRLHDDLVWSYPTPEHDAEPVRDLFAFYNERVDLELDGEREERPRTQWSRGD
jgi:uncharacterized protein (DUF427 family)